MDTTVSRVPQKDTAPSEVECLVCGLFLLPYVADKDAGGMLLRFAPDAKGRELWACFRCQRGVIVAWGIVA